MKRSIFASAKAYLDSAGQWYLKTPERAIDRAYKAALMIKAMEDEHFGGKKISAASGQYGESAMVYFEAKLEKYLKDTRLSLSEFKISNAVFNLGSKNYNQSELNGARGVDRIDPLSVSDQQSILLEKLQFIDEVLTRYDEDEFPSSALMVVSQNPNNSQSLQVNVSNVSPTPVVNYGDQFTDADPPHTSKKGDSIADKTGVVPRSILRTLDRLKRNLSPNAEQEVIRDFRNTQNRTVRAIRFILTLILVPLLTQQVVKALVVGPVIDHVRMPETTEIFLNADYQMEAFEELQRFEELLKFKTMIGIEPNLSAEERENKIRDKAEEIKENYWLQGQNAIKNIFADIAAVIVFCLVLINSKREIAILKGFIDEVVYGLSDSAKAFIIILFTDIFVGFHSPHGWEVILEGFSRHLGIPENRQFIFLFIATFPVILDTIFKYWIFRYLNRISPSAVATYRNMNE